MRRGDIVVVAAEGYAGKPRPAVVIQSDDFSEIGSLCVCLVTTGAQDSPLLRLAVKPGASNGLEHDSWIMVDKMTMLPLRKIGRQIGRLSTSDLVRLDRSLLVFLGLVS